MTRYLTTQTKLCGTPFDNDRLVVATIKGYSEMRVKSVFLTSTCSFGINVKRSLWWDGSEILLLFSVYRFKLPYLTNKYLKALSIIKYNPKVFIYFPSNIKAGKAKREIYLVRCRRQIILLKRVTRLRCIWYTSTFFLHPQTINNCS